MKPTLAISTALLAFSGLAASHDVGQHPAVFAARALPGVDPSTFIVGHPASPMVRGGHANHEHPALLATRRGEPAAIDANTFIVQPPASVAWTLGAAAALPSQSPLLQSSVPVARLDADTLK